MSDLKFTEDHAWVRMDGDVVTIGITDFAQDQLGDVVFVQLPEEGAVMSVGQEAAVIESVKAAGEIKSPLSGVVVEVNTALLDAPERINDDPTGEGWFYRLKVAGDDASGALLNEDAYRALITT
ncbi:MAG: glycine cleavage system protein GcvH [Arenicellales bacterium]|jgi:glycine cleavage system H protein|nr:glycine cleavage system protein GcvH [Gammaproteobacteria bacterium]NDA14638.1 glycine cleavage system protein GcvH [Gammaproteobacteria bacterium]NDG44137.1 glycine cleavage system protein GcvH [Gammaproteobacteria bacterium]